MGAKRMDLDGLLKSSDFVSLHIPHTKDSHYLINKKTISFMKPTAHLINCSRGGIVEEAALYDALKNKKIAGASIDVFEKEPVDPDNKLLKFENVVLSPHLGANTKEAQIRAGTICADQVIMVLSGKEPKFWVNKKFMQKEKL
jgi:D-3-phosphoglycerate dehydrogenase